jgi:hypothetical protein
MLRKVLLVVLATVVSHLLAALSGYVLYQLSTGLSEANLGVMARYTAGPLIAILTGSLVGFLSKDHPVPTSMVGLAPLWVLNLFSPNKPTWASLVSGFTYIALGGIAALFAFRLRRRLEFVKRSDVGRGVTTP